MFAVVGHRRPGRPVPPLRARPRAALSLVAALCLASPATAFGQAAAPVTIWSFLGVPNPFGINAADQKSDNPAIQAAAKAKAAKHEICKKKKAIQYLAGLGCTPEHPEVGPALIAAMSDPDEPVRYEAVKAVLQTAGDCQSSEQKREAKHAQSHSDRCHDLKKKIEKAFCDCIDRLCGKAPPIEHKHKNAFAKLLGQEECEHPAKKDCECAAGLGACCSPEMREKLSALAYGRDDAGCFLERSQRVRDMAEQALHACNACSSCGACGNCGPCAEGGSDHAIRELPAVDAREEPPTAGGGDGVYDRLMVPVPAEQPLPETVPAPAPAARPPLPPAPEPIPLPPSVLVPSHGAARSAALPPPSGVRRFGGAPTPDMVASTRPRRAGASGIWNPSGPGTIFDTHGGDGDPGFPPYEPPSRLEQIRLMTGTAALGERMTRWPTPPATGGPAGMYDEMGAKLLTDPRRNP